MDRNAGAVVGGSRSSGWAARDDRVIVAVLVIFATYMAGIAALGLAAPHTFFTKVGPFGSPNSHYTRDGATFELAFAFAAAAAARLPRWRAPVLATLALQSLFHAVNHLVDIGNAHPKWLGPFDFFGLAFSTVILGWAYFRVRREEATT
jgi:hypothetical protein